MNLLPEFYQYLIPSLKVLGHALKDNFVPKTNLAVSSTEFCQCTFDEGDIGIRYGNCRSFAIIWLVHRSWIAMI